MRGLKVSSPWKRPPKTWALMGRREGSTHVCHTNGSLWKRGEKVILMHFINQTLVSCCIRSSAPPGRMSPPMARGPALGCPALQQPPILTASATPGSCSSSGWHGGSGRGGQDRVTNWHPMSLGLPQRRALPRHLAQDQGCITLPGVLPLAPPSYQSFRFPWQSLELKGWGKGQKKSQPQKGGSGKGWAKELSCHPFSNYTPQYSQTHCTR